MEFHLSSLDLDPNAANRAAPEETKVIQLTAQPYSDGYRVRVDLETTPFQQRPSIEVILSDADGDEVASTNIVEPLSWKIEFTMHIRGDLNTPYTLSARLYYPDGPQNEPFTCSFEVKPPEAN